MDQEQREFLESKFRSALADQPQLQQLSDLLLEIGGAFVVAPNKIDRDVAALIARGFVMTRRVVLNRIASNGCHSNVAELWRGGSIIGIATGYALSRDKLWRQHSWGMRRDGVMLETTEKRLKYFGILLQDESANVFASSN
jgi:hypothetical protein